MAKSSTPIPKGVHSITPYLMVKDPRKAIEFYKQAFGATDESIMEIDGKIMHARFRIGDSTIFMCQEFPEMDKLSAESRGFTTSSLMIYTEDVDAMFDKAIKAGCTPVMQVQDMFWGDRYGHVTDPFKQEWAIATHKEDLSPDEIEANYREIVKNFAGACK